MPTVAIIVPIYNVEPYFDQCVQSLLNQTYRDIEIILVDDGSPDGCPAMCDAYAAQDDRVRVLHQENQGVSVARNAGIDLAEGEWIMFCDPDDWYELNAVEVMLEHATKHDSDVAAFGLINPQLKNKRLPIAKTESVFTNTFDICALAHTWSWGVNSRLYRRSLIVKNNIRFTPGMVITQDLMFSLKSLILGKRISLGSQCLYNYRITGQSNSCGRRYRPDVYDYYNRIDKEMVDFLTDALPPEAYKPILSTQRAMLLINAFNVTYQNPNAPFNLSQRLQGMREKLSMEPWKTSFMSSHPATSFKQKLQLFLLRHRLLFLYYLIKKIWNFKNRYENFLN